jgi:hypothetical protein
MGCLLLCASKRLFVRGERRSLAPQEPSSCVCIVTNTHTHTYTHTHTHTHHSHRRLVLGHGLDHGRGRRLVDVDEVKLEGLVLDLVFGVPEGLSMLINCAQLPEASSAETSRRAPLIWFSASLEEPLRRCMGAGPRGQTRCRRSSQGLGLGFRFRVP